VPRGFGFWLWWWLMAPYWWRYWWLSWLSGWLTGIPIGMPYLTKEQEIAILEEQKRSIEEELNWINKRLEELKGKVKG